LKITFVGTGSGKTNLKRNHSSLLFSFNDYKLLIDAGDGISRSLIEANIDFNSINAILFTHLHPDHFSGLSALIVQMKMFNRNAPLQIYVYENFVQEVKDYLITCNLLSEKMDFETVYNPFSDNREFIINEELKILPRENSHLSELKKYDKYSNRTFYSASFLFSYKDKNLIYTADIGSQNDLELFKDFKLDILISEITHITILDIFDKIDLLGSPKIYLTHVPEDDEAKINDYLNKKSEKVCKIELAYDRQIIEF
jgi:ribonuclease Z